ncbi:hypothetical protein G9A89_001029 [Geosiphon pyriformis]|nr:hypothetical protein G9A89_001029 [Geosiphon pyriformis]
MEENRTQSMSIPRIIYPENIETHNSVSTLPNHVDFTESDFQNIEPLAIAPPAYSPPQSNLQYFSTNMGTLLENENENEEREENRKKFTHKNNPIMTFDIDGYLLFGPVPLTHEKIENRKVQNDIFFILYLGYLGIIFVEQLGNGESASFQTFFIATLILSTVIFFRILFYWCSCGSWGTIDDQSYWYYQGNNYGYPFCFGCGDCDGSDCSDCGGCDCGDCNC